MPDAPNGRRDVAGMVCAAGFVLLGLYIFLGAQGMSQVGSIFPTTIAVGMIAFSLALIVAILTGRAAPAMLRKESECGSSHRLGLAVVMATWVALLSVIGFVVISLAAFAAIMVIADYDRPRLRTWVIWSASGVAIVLGFWWIMADVLLLRMPAGVLF